MIAKITLNFMTKVAQQNYLQFYDKASSNV